MKSHYRVDDFGKGKSHRDKQKRRKCIKSKARNEFNRDLAIEVE